MHIVELFTEKLDYAPQYLAKFADEIRNTSGQPYSPDSLLHLFKVLQMYLKDLSIPVNIFKDANFEVFRRKLNKRMKTLTHQGYRKPQRKAEIITEEMEKQLWTSKILGTENPRMLLRTVYFLSGKLFALRSRDEHRKFRVGPTAQIKVTGMGSKKKLVYSEDYSKNNSGGLLHSKFKPKTQEIFSSGGIHCPVKIFEFYLSKIPPKATSFYCRPNGENTTGKTFSKFF